jgi:hypothetical protein
MYATSSLVPTLKSDLHKAKGVTALKQPGYLMCFPKLDLVNPGGTLNPLRAGLKV